jgi:hypothetical protein
MSPILLAVLSAYYASQWSFYPSMSDVACIAVSPANVYVAVPHGVYIFDSRTLDYRRCLTASDGIDGELEVCAWNAARSELLVASRAGLYSFLPQTGLLQELNPPFRRVSSIGATRSGAWLETDRGLFHKHLTLDQYERADSAPSDIRWQGALDPTTPRDFVFLTPYFYTDDQLINHGLGVVGRDTRRHRLFAAAQGYGLLQYDLRSGLLERKLRFGHVDQVRRIERGDGSLWFVGGGHLTTVDSVNGWRSYALGSGLALPPVLSRRLVELAGSVNALVDRNGSTIYATDRGLVSVDNSGKTRPMLRTTRPLLSLLWLGDSLLVGTDEGLYLRQADSLLRLTEPTGRTDWGVYGMATPGDGSLWFATLGGLVTRSSDGEWQRITPPGVDLSAPVRAIAADGRRLFAGFGNGLGAYELSSGAWTYWDSNDGVPAGPITALHAEDGLLWLATPGVISVFRYRQALPRPEH